MISYLLNHNYNMSLVHHVAPLALGTAAGDAHHKPVLKPCFLNSDPQFTDLLVCMYVNVLYHYITLSGWWLGTFLFFSMYWEFHHPNWLFFFQRGRSTTNQYKMVLSHGLYPGDSGWPRWSRIAYLVMIIKAWGQMRAQLAHQVDTFSASPGMVQQCLGRKLKTHENPIILKGDNWKQGYN